MGEHKPGRELDVLVHRALWPEHKVGIDAYIDPSFDKTCRLELPRYSTDLSAWDWTREGWHWSVTEWPEGRTGVAVGTGGALGHFYSEVDGYGFAAQAYARCLCVLQWVNEQP